MHDAAFADSVRPARSVILRLAMRPYSIGHEILLLQQRNPIVILSPQEFSVLEKPDQIAAIIRAIIICHRDWEENKSPAKHLWLWNYFNRNADWPLEIAEFRNYRNAGMDTSPAPTEEADTIANGEEEIKGRNLGGPFLARLYNFVAALPSVKEPFDFQLGLAAFLYFSDLEAKGEMKLENRKEFEIRHEMEGHRAAITGGAE